MTKPRTASQINWLAKRRQMRNEFLEDKVCSDCGGADQLLVAWRQLPGPIPMSKLWQVREELRVQYLPLATVRCITCKNKRAAELVKVEHGGGTQGIFKCQCPPCKKARSDYNGAWQKRKRARDKALRALSQGTKD